MADKTAATYHSAPCAGECCTQNRHLGVCAHGRACRFHLTEEAKRIRAEKETIAAMEFRKAWM